MKKEKDIVEEIRKLEQNRFWGTIQIRYRDGKPVIMVKEETFRLDDK